MPRKKKEPVQIPDFGTPSYWDYAKEVGFKEFRKESKKTGRPKAIPTPEYFWQLACSYFKEIDENPLPYEDFIRGGQNAGTKVTMYKKRPYTWMGFEAWLLREGVINDVKDYKMNKDGAYDEFRAVISKVDAIMWQQKYEGAVCGLFNPSIIAWDLGMRKNEDDEKAFVREVNIILKEKQ